ncbi:unnamed protein product [Boreogadus saida]
MMHEDATEWRSDVRDEDATENEWMAPTRDGFAKSMKGNESEQRTTHGETPVEREGGEDAGTEQTAACRGTSHPLHPTLVALASFPRTVGDPCTVREGQGSVSRPQPRPEGPSIEQRCPLSPGEGRAYTHPPGGNQHPCLDFKYAYHREYKAQPPR